MKGTSKNILLGLLLLVAVSAWAYDYGWYANMSGLNEVPPNASPATGFTGLNLTADGDSLEYHAEWSGFLGNYTASHIHRGVAGVAGPVVHPLQNAGPTGADGAWGPLSGTPFAPQNIVQLYAESLYVNAHTTVFPGGEIRGQIICSPDNAVFDASTDVGESQCIQLCPEASSFIRIQNIPAGQFPVVIKRLGCLSATNPCEVNCYPATYIEEFFNGQWQWTDGWFWLEIRGDGCICVTLDRILAVEMGDFAAIAGDAEVTLQWNTRSERDNDHFEIERNGQLAGTVPSQGSNSSGGSYAWTDAGLTNGIAYAYSLFAVDVNGNRSEVATESATPTAPSMVNEYALLGNYPNPFNPETQITFDLAEAGLVHLNVYNMLGRQVATVVDYQLAQGRHTVSFTAGNLPSGVYLYRLEVNGFTDQRKMLLLK